MTNLELVEDAPSGPLSRTERMNLIDLETNIEEGLETFVLVGASLDSIRTQKLYREDYETFEEYCKTKWGWGSSRARQLIGASKTVLSITGEYAPANEAQTRQLNRLPDARRQEAWDAAVRAAHGQPDPETIRQEVEKRLPKPPEPPKPPKGPTPSTSTAPAPKKSAGDISEPSGEIVVEAEVTYTCSDCGEADVPEEDGVCADCSAQPDPYEEIERLTRENRRLTDLLDRLESGEAGEELKKASEQIARLEGSLRLATTQKGEAARQARYATKRLREIRDLLEIERDRDILPRLRVMLGHAEG